MGSARGAWNDTKGRGSVAACLREHLIDEIDAVSARCAAEIRGKRHRAERAAIVRYDCIAQPVVPDTPLSTMIFLQRVHASITETVMVDALI
jgi:hypothetical protein